MYCGVFSPGPETVQPQSRQRQSLGPVACPRCGMRKSRIDAIRRHFGRDCIRMNGNPNSLVWTDDPTYKEGARLRKETRKGQRQKMRQRKDFE